MRLIALMDSKAVTMQIVIESFAFVLNLCYGNMINARIMWTLWIVVCVCRMCQSDSPLSFPYVNFESNFAYRRSWLREKLNIPSICAVVENSSRSNSLAAIVIMNIHFSFNFLFRRFPLPFHSRRHTKKCATISSHRCERIFCRANYLYCVFSIFIFFVCCACAGFIVFCMLGLDVRYVRSVFDAQRQSLFYLFLAFIFDASFVRSVLHSLVYICTLYLQMLRCMGSYEWEKL